MKKIYKLLTISALLLSSSIWAQCISPSAYGAATVASTGTTNLTTCAYGGEYSTATFTATGSYIFNGTGGTGNYITITNAVNLVLAHGWAPLGYVVPATGVYRVHLSRNNLCATESACHTISVAGATFCNSPSQYGGASIATTGTTNITTCNYGGEFSVNTFNSTGIYTITATGGTGNYLTVKNVAGTIIYAQGLAPIAFNVPATGIYRIHLATTAPPACGTDGSCHNVNAIAPAGGGGPPAPPNDLCANAITLAIPSTTAGTTVNATLEAPAPPTCITTLNQPGVWYKVVGNGNRLGASLCATSAWDSKIFVYTGTCGAWTCVTGNDDNGPLCAGAAASGTWCSIPGVNYYILATGYSGSSAFNIAITQTVTVAPIVAIAASSSTICAGASSTLTASGASTYLWGGALGTTAAITVSPSTTTIYTVTGTNACATPNVNTFTVTVNASPTITVNSGAVCAGNSFTMSAAGASTYSYSGGSAIVAPASNTSYTVTGSNAFGCISSAVSTVSVNALPIITVNSGSICNGSSFTMIPSGASTYTYSSGSAVVAPTTNTFYLVTGTSAAGCVSSSGAVSTIVVNAIPLVTVNSGSICNGSSFTMIPGGASTYTYSSGSAVVAPTTNTSYTVTGASAAGCLGAALSSVTVNAVPIITVNSGTICSGGSFTMVPTGAFSYTYSGGSAVVAPTTNTTYTVTGSSAAGCVGLSGALSAVTVNALPIITVNSGAICSGKSFTMVPSGASSYTYSGGLAVVAPTTNTSYTVTGSNLFGCIGSAVSTVSVNALPIITVNSGSICNGSSFTMVPAGASTYTYSSGSAVVAPTTNTSYTVTGTSVAGCTNTAVSSVVVNALPVVTVNSGSICNGSSFTMVPAGASTYAYSSGLAVVAPTANTSYTVTGTSAAGCVGSSGAVSSVVVNAIPIVTVNSGSICNGSSFTMIPAGASTYTYSSGSAVVAPTTNTSYTVTGTNAAGCVGSSGAVSSVVVNALPVVTVNSGSICNGSSFTMIPAGASTYTYSSGSAVVAPTTNTSYTVTGTNAAGCVGSSGAVSSVVVNALPVVTVNSGAICNGSSFTMIPAGASTYTYSGGSSVVSPLTNTSYTVTGTSAAGCVGSSGAVSSVIVNANPVVTVSSGSICNGSSFTMIPGGASTYIYSSGSAVVAPTANTSYTVTGTSVAGCTNTAVSSVTVNANPVVTVNSGAICSGASFTMVPAGASTYVYTGGTAVVSPTANTSYTVIGTNAAGCTANAVSSLTVDALPILSVTSGSICSGNSFTMVPTGATTYTYSGGSAVVSPSVTTSYTVSGSNAAGCVSNVVNTITVSATPVIVASSGAVCTGGSFTISPTGATTYTYSSGSSVVSPTATTSYTVSGSSATGCQSSAVITVSVNPTLAFSANSGSVCSGSTFTMTPSGATSYTYSSGTAAVTPTATTTYTIVGVNSVGCFGTQICTVTVNALPVVSATSSNTLICLGGSAILTASTTAATSTYTWSSGATTMSTSVTPTVLTVYTVNVKDSITTCGASASITVDVSPCTGINEITENSISIYPNPSFGFVKIILTTQFVNNSSITIYDALGKLILTQELGNEINTLNISELKNGMYTYKVLNNSNIVKIGKIVKQ